MVMALAMEGGRRMGWDEMWDGDGDGDGKDAGKEREKETTRGQALYKYFHLSANQKKGAL